MIGVISVISYTARAIYHIYCLEKNRVPRFYRKPLASLDFIKKEKK
jgi:hypothetical protein